MGVDFQEFGVEDRVIVWWGSVGWGCGAGEDVKEEIEECCFM